MAYAEGFRVVTLVSDEDWDKMTTPEYIQFTRQWIGECHRVLKNHGAIYISCTYHNLSEAILVLKQLNFKINNVIVWQKTNAMPNMTKRVFTHSTEFVIWAVNAAKTIINEISGYIIGCCVSCWGDELDGLASNTPPLAKYQLFYRQFITFKDAFH